MTTNYRALCAEMLSGWQEGRDIVGPMSRHPATPPAPDPEDVGELIHCLRIREQSLSQQNYKLVQLGDAAYFGRAATRLEQQEDKLAAMTQLLAKQLTEPAKALVEPANHQRLSELGSEPPWNRPGWCDAEGRCWLCIYPDDGWHVPTWRLARPRDCDMAAAVKGESVLTHSLPHWAIQRPRSTSQPAPQAGEGEA